MVIHLELGKDSYDILLKRGALDSAGEHFDLDRKVLVVTDDGVPQEYAAKVTAACREPFLIVLKQGEQTKNFDNFRKLMSLMLTNSFTRKDCVVAVGGGVVGDLAGFAAACYMRGVDFYNIPTTLLSQVDSSIGGKTAIDLDGVKNVVGAFHQPKKVLIDPDTLKTLDNRHLMAGLAEAVKMAACADEELFELIEESDSLEDDLEEIIAGALEIKKDIVEMDPKEEGIRRILNFGHTVGHAIESFYAGKYLHGECVAMGMLLMCGDEAGKRIRRVLEKYGLPTEYDAGAKELMPYLLHDKKSLGNTISTIYVTEIGSCRIRDEELAALEERL